MASVQNQSDSENTKTIITVLLLVFVYPVGLIVMWFLPRWRTWVKILLSLPVILLIVGLLSSVALIAINPAKKINNAKQIQPAITSPSTSPSVKAKPSGLR